MVVTEEKNEIDKNLIKFKGKYINAVGRRKRSVAQVRLYKNGRGNIVVNGLKLSKYFNEGKALIVSQPLKLTGHIRDLDFSIFVSGGGNTGQAEAVRHGISRALVLYDDKLKSAIKAKSWLTRDSRQVERKKPGLKKARRAPQWSKR